MTWETCLPCDYSVHFFFAVTIITKSQCNLMIIDKKYFDEKCF